MDQSCATKYPIMLIHGIGYQDNGSGGYWGRIPDVLRSHGAELWFGNQDAFGTIEHNAAQLKVSVENALRQSGAEKLNLIAHSKGGIEARYLISRLDMAERIASLTTMATPHRGIVSMDRMKKRARQVYDGLVALFNRMLTVDGGENNVSLKVYEQMTADYMQVFNMLVPDMKGVYYQSYAFDMKNALSDPAMSIFYSFVRRMEGPNDGLVSVESAKWGDFRGVYSGPGRHGISHPVVVDSKKRKLSTRRRSGGILDITDLYWDIVCRLKSLGY
ncbi:esterase/lipase family protein [Zhenpiania hominis]|uniref:esterase/lipase family protein n=1 Tax=Zhenpiania hominis TaxID=2763644 RepID=UPI0039F52AF8